MHDFSVYNIINITQMSLTQLFQKNLRLQMKLIHIIDKKPKNIVKLDGLDPEDFIISLQAVKEWSEDNVELYSLILQNGMAEYICNRQYLYEFYKTLQFYNKNLRIIDSNSLKFKNLKQLNLTRNNIKIIDNIPIDCRQLYLDFNQIQDINQKRTYKLQLLSLSNNVIDDQAIIKIANKCQDLRCLNVSWNRICKLKEFVTILGGLQKLKILISNNNPISLLNIYYTYITQHLHLTFIDGNKYVKEEPKKQQPKIQQKKQVVKEQKKDIKKDNKKGAKVQQKAPQQPKIEVPKVQPKRQLTKQDFQRAIINIKITNFQKFLGNLYDINLFPVDIDIKKTQTNYWIKYQFMSQEVNLVQKCQTFDSATIQNDEIRLNFDIDIKKTVQINYQNFQSFNKGIKIDIYQKQPKMLKDSQTYQLKPEIINGQVTTVTSILCSTHIDLRKIHLFNKKELKLKFLMFKNQAVSNALFFDPYENQFQIINKRKEVFEKEQKQLQLQKIKKSQQQQLLKQQKKGTKDTKKQPEKKAAKKDGKDPVLSDKKKAQKCDFAVDERQFCVIDENKLYKGKELICLQLQIN